MRAAVYHGVRDVRLEDVPEPEAGPGQVKLRVTYNGVCGTDLHEIFDSQRGIPSSPHPLTGAHSPLILGHEIAGTVVDAGEGVDGFADGELVTVEPMWRCGVCEWCLAGDFNLCERLAFHGMATDGGGLAEYTVLPAYTLHRVPAGMSPADAAMAESLAVADHAVVRSGARPGQRTIVLGGGPIGIGAMFGLRRRGVEVVAVVEPSAERRAVLEQLGATTLDPAAGSLLEQLDGRHVDITFETAAAPASLRNALHVTKPQGLVMLVAAPRDPFPPVLNLALIKELEIRASFAYRGEFPEVIDAIAAGTYQLDTWVTTQPMTELHDAFDHLRAGERLKILIDPTG